MYINIASVHGQIYNADGTVAQWAATNLDPISTVFGTPGHAIFRDMGKVVYLPSGGNNSSTILRKVQYVPANSENGTGGSPENDYYTGYIRIGGMTYGGGDGVPTPVARIS